MGFGEDTLPGVLSRPGTGTKPLVAALFRGLRPAENAPRGHVNAADDLVNGTFSRRTRDNRRYARLVGRSFRQQAGRRWNVLRCRLTLPLNVVLYYHYIERVDRDRVPP